MTNEELKIFVKKNPAPVVCGVIALAVGVALYFRSGALATAEQELAQKSAQAEKYALNIKNAAQLKDQLEMLVAANKKIESRLTRASQQGTNTQYFYKLAREADVKITSFNQSTPNTKNTKTAFTGIGFSVSVQGELSQILNFLRQLESGTHYCRVLGASGSISPKARNSPLILTLNLELLGQP